MIFAGSKLWMAAVLCVICATPKKSNDQGVGDLRNDRLCHALLKFIFHIVLVVFNLLPLQKYYVSRALRFSNTQKRANNLQWLLLLCLLLLLATVTALTHIHIHKIPKWSNLWNTHNSKNQLITTDKLHCRNLTFVKAP